MRLCGVVIFGRTGAGLQSRARIPRTLTTSPYGPTRRPCPTKSGRNWGTKFSDYLPTRFPQGAVNPQHQSEGLSHFLCPNSGHQHHQLTAVSRQLSIAMGHSYGKRAGTRVCGLGTFLGDVMQSLTPTSSTPSAGTSARRVSLPSTPTFDNTSQYFSRPGLHSRDGC